MPETTTGKELLSVEIAELDKRTADRFGYIQEIRTSQIAGLREIFEAKFNAIKEAVDKAEHAQEKRFDAVNEFRNQMGDQQRTYMTRAEATSEINSLHQQMTAITARFDRTENRGAGMGALIGYICGAAGAVGVVFTIFEAMTKR